MPGVEDLSREEQQAVRLGALLLKDPDIARQAKRLATKVDPTLRIPELDLEDKIAQAAAKSEERAAGLEKQLLEERVRSRRQDLHRRIEAEGLEVAEVEKIVVDESCSIDTALKLAKLQRETGEPTAARDFGTARTLQGTPIDLRPEKAVRNLTGNALKKWSFDQAHALVDQLRGRPARRTGSV